MAKLLIVDGSPMMHRIMELTFAPEGIQVLTASDGDQAIALLPVARPDIVIADHALSGRSGYEVAAFVKGLGRGIPVLLLASPFEPLDRARAEACGVTGEISKPFEPGQLVARVRALLAATPAEPVPEPVAAADGRVPPLKLVEPTAPPPRGALDDYFDRLDAALERLDEQIAAPAASEGTASGARAPRDEDFALPTLEKLLGEERAPARGGVLIDHPLRGAYVAANEAAGSDGTSEAVLEEAEPPARGSDLGALIEALEALRRKSPAADLPSVPDVTKVAGDAAPAHAELSEAAIDEIAARVVQRLAPGAISAVVTDVVTRVAERLLREEIARLK